MNNLVVLIMTFKLNKEINSSNYLPKVCQKLGNKTMIEITIENALKLNPELVIVYVSKNNIQCINKILKHTSYSSMISYCVLDNEISSSQKQKLSLASKCFANKNILAIPGNAPLLTSRSLFRIISSNNDIKLMDNLFYLKKENLNIIDIISDLPNVKFDIPEYELRLVETKSDLKEVEKIYENKNDKIY